MKTPYSSHCYRLAVLFLLVTFAVCSWTRQFCDSSCSSGGSCSDCKGGPTFQLGREVLRQTAVIQDSQWCFPGVSQPLLDPLPRGKQMKKRVFPAKSHCGFPEQLPLLHKSLSRIPWEQKSCKSSCSVPSSSLALAHSESGEAKEVQEQLQKAAEALKMLQGIRRELLVRFCLSSGLQQMPAEGTALCKVF